MDAVSYAHSAKQAQRIEKFIENPDSNSGVLTQPKVIEAGETVTIKSGRQAILADTVVDGDLVIEAGGDVFVPAGAGFSDLDQRLDTIDNRTINGVTFGGSANMSVGLSNQSGAISTPFTLDNTYKNRLLVCDNGITITLPTINTIKSGDLFYITNGGTDPLTLALNGNSTSLNTLKVTGNETLIIQSDGGSFYRCISRGAAPVYDFDTNLIIPLSYNVVFRADRDLTLVVICAGSFMNGVEIVIGTTTSPARVVSRTGDDINTNTKYATLTAVITAGLYFKVRGFGGNDFETIEITAYKHK